MVRHRIAVAAVGAFGYKPPSGFSPSQARAALPAAIVFEIVGFTPSLFPCLVAPVAFDNCVKLQVWPVILLQHLSSLLTRV